MAAVKSNGVSFKSNINFNSSNVKSLRFATFLYSQIYSHLWRIESTMMRTCNHAFSLVRAKETNLREILV